jgi:hypothetical protein
MNSAVRLRTIPVWRHEKNQRIKTHNDIDHKHTLGRINSNHGEFGATIDKSGGN